MGRTIFPAGQEKTGVTEKVDPIIANESSDAGILHDLKGENDELRGTIVDLEKRLEEASQAVQFCTEQHGDYERLLEEKSEVIRDLHGKIQELQARPAAGSPRDEELVALSEELEQERRQLKEDEEALMKQMRDMEVQMSRERADIARQRNELLRLQEDLRRELELAARQTELRERLLPLQRRHQELVHHKGTERPRQAAPSEEPESPATPPVPSRSRDSGLLRRLFGG
jgi:chromosome segregation ATPase